MGRLGSTEKGCCVKEKFVRYTVVKFKNNKFGVLDRNHYHLIQTEGYPNPIDRNNHKQILLSGQSDLKTAKKIAASLNKEVNLTEFQENN